MSERPNTGLPSSSEVYRDEFEDLMDQWLLWQRRSMAARDRGYIGLARVYEQKCDEAYPRLLAGARKFGLGQRRN